MDSDTTGDLTAAIGAAATRAFECLRNGHLREGWRLYEVRWAFPDYPGNNLPMAAPRLQKLPNAAGRRILLWHEQGLGDMILMLRFVPAITRVAASVVLAVQPGLKRLAIVSVPGLDSVVSDGDTFEDVDCHAPLMSLPFLLRTRLATIPTQVPYLHPPADLVATWRQRLGPTPDLRVGLVWRGNPDQGQDARRSMSPTALAPLLRLHGIEYHVLQDRLTETDRAFLAQTPGTVRTHASRLTDLAETAALALNMDLIITVDTAVAHLAGALGRPVWVALSAESYWVWMTEREDSPWYPTARLFRQTAPDDWGPVIERLAYALWQRRPTIVLS